MIDCYLAPRMVAYLLGLDAGCAATLGAEAVVSAEPMSLLRYAALFGWTVALEAPAYFLLWRRRPAGVSVRSFAALIMTLNLATHPMVTFAFPQFAVRAGWSIGGGQGVAEAFAFGIESLLLVQAFGFSRQAAVVAAVLANLCSWWGGGVLAINFPQLFAG